MVNCPKLITTKLSITASTVQKAQLKSATSIVVSGIDAPFAGHVFKVQANTDKNHRDRIAFLRVASGRFERGMTITHGPSQRQVTTKYVHSVQGQDRETVDEAFPGDVIG